MPIIESVSETEPLSQGDVLKGVKLFSTDSSGEGPVQSKATYCLVLSRPCVVAHKVLLTVAAIEEFKFSIANTVESFDEMLAVMTSIRDASQSPDVFYLGALPSVQGRFCARLEQLHCLLLPQGEQRTSFLQRHRIAKLDVDFSRDLHLRLFRSYASLGFDDLSWFPTEDLQSILQFADTDVSRAQTRLQGLKATKERQQLQDKKFNESDLSAAERSLNELNQKFDPYRQELQRRTPNHG